MILFVNVFVTNQRFWGKHAKLKATRVHDKLDIFLYMLSSYASISWSEVHIYYDIDSEFEHRKDEAKKHITELFPENLFLNSYRISTQRDWSSAIDRLNPSNNELIWFTCNDDHIFIDSDLKTLESAVDVARKCLQATPHVAILVSHWQEAVASLERYRLAKKIGYHQAESLYYRAAALWREADCTVTSYKTTAGIQIVSKALLAHWFSDCERLPTDLRRTDLIMSCPDDQVTIIPDKEMARHFDGYSHVGIPFRLVPVMMIPEGFFEEGIKIFSGGEKRRPGFVWLQPLRTMWGKEILHYDRDLDDGRCDSNLELERVPLFWKCRIVEQIELDVEPVGARRARLVQQVGEILSDNRLGFTPKTALAFLSGGGLGVGYAELSRRELSSALRKAWSPLKRLRWLWFLVGHWLASRPFALSPLRASVRFIRRVIFRG